MKIFANRDDLKGYFPYSHNSLETETWLGFLKTHFSVSLEYTSTYSSVIQYPELSITKSIYPPKNRDSSEVAVFSIPSLFELKYLSMFLLAVEYGRLPYDFASLCGSHHHFSSISYD